MKPLFYFFVVFSLLTFCACSEKDETPAESIEDNWYTNIDTTAELVVLVPDIQMYTYISDNNRYLDTMITRLLQLKAHGYRIKAVLQTGDITNRHNTGEWEIAKNIFSKLDNNIPYILCTGNHDYESSTRNTAYSRYFDYSSDGYYLASFRRGRYENSAFRISLARQPFIIYSLEFAPSDEVLAWADSIAGANSGDAGMVLTHAYLYKNKERFNFSAYGYNQLNSPYDYNLPSSENINDGEEIWQKLVYPNDAIRFVLCGHMDYPNYAGNLISINVNGNRCLQMLFDTQSFPKGGEGLVQVLAFNRDQKTVDIYTCSLTEGIWLVGGNLHYRFEWN